MTEYANMLTPGQAARALGVSAQWVCELAKAGRLAHIQTPLGRLFDPVAVERMRVAREKARA